MDEDQWNQLADQYRNSVDFHFRLLHKYGPRDSRYLDMTEEEMYLELLAHHRHREENIKQSKGQQAQDEGTTVSDIAAFEHGLEALSRGASMDDVLAAANEAGKRAHREIPAETYDETYQDESPDFTALEEQLAALLSSGG